jgi:hypothetical protein
MKYKFYMIPVIGSEKAEAELNSFCDQHRIAHLEKHFVMDGDNSFWSVCVTWLPQDGCLAQHAGREQRKPRVDYKEVLNDAEFQHFSELRDLRKSSRETGYVHARRGMLPRLNRLEYRCYHASHLMMRLLTLRTG